MEIPKRLSKLKFHFLFGVALSLLIFSRVYLSPKFVDVVAFFGPLFLSTALFLLAVLVFGRTLPPAAEPPGEKAAEVILDLVTAQPLLDVQVQPTAEEEEEEEEEEERVLIRNKQTQEEAQAAGAESVESEQKM
ncbi:hypothetical protein RHGRI_009422 [Rhododendron griersonianum]|uniref:Uncharacterized protein n=1 Tax=Rhododendron griersonianum TaxID=479676 RepID=A0AAV6KEQ6_9ERIC|nr:hypothetical protein RHGRI_009422 [Rhododendron griersonianum]